MEIFNTNFFVVTVALVVVVIIIAALLSGLLGDFGFTPAGDITETPVSVLRVGDGGGSRRVSSIEGGELERVMRPPARLVE